MNAGLAERRLVLLVAEYGYFVSHRLALARAAVAAGYRVFVVTQVGDDRDLPDEPGVTIVPFAVRRSFSPLRDASTVIRLIPLLRSLRPDIVHNVSIKMAILGTIAARLSGTAAIVNAYTGLGRLFGSGDAGTTLLRYIVLPSLWWIGRHRRTWSVFQNQHDLQLFLRRRLACAERARLIEGSGVDVGRFAPAPHAVGVPLVLFAGRLLRDKGIAEFADASRLLRSRGVAARFVVVGEPDAQNPGTVDHQTLENWCRESIVEWWGYRTDMPQVYRQAAIVCVPTFYNEGLPKVLLEACACARPVIASRIPGCTAVIEDGINGFLIEPRNATALADCIERLLSDAALRETMGAAARRTVETRFAQETVNRRFLELYESLESPGTPVPEVPA
jgi:glycosyltransferase involved in cell wall biosynthesis